MADISGIDLGLMSHEVTGQMTGVMVKDVLNMVRNVLSVESADLGDDDDITLDEIKLYDSDFFAHISRQNDMMAYQPHFDSFNFDSSDSSSGVGRPVLPSTDIGCYLHANWRTSKIPPGSKPPVYMATLRGEEALRVRLVCGRGEDSDEEDDQDQDVGVNMEEQPDAADPEWRLSECDPGTSSAPDLANTSSKSQADSPSAASASSSSSKILPSLDLRGIFSRSRSRNSEISGLSVGSGKSSGSGGTSLPTLATSPTVQLEAVFSPRGPTGDALDGVFSPRDTVMGGRDRVGSLPVPIPSEDAARLRLQRPRSRAGSAAQSPSSSCRSPNAPLRLANSCGSAASGTSEGAPPPHGIVLTVQYQALGCSWWKVGLSLDCNGMVYVRSPADLACARSHADGMLGESEALFSASSIGMGSLSISEGSNAGGSYGAQTSSHSLTMSQSPPSHCGRSGSSGPLAGSEGSGKGSGSAGSSFAGRIGAWRATLGQVLPSLRSRQSTPAAHSGITSSGSSYSSKASSLGSMSAGVGSGVQSPRTLSPLSVSPSHAHGRSLGPGGSASPPVGSPGSYTGAEMQRYAASAPVDSDQQRSALHQQLQQQGEVAGASGSSSNPSSWGGRKGGAMKLLGLDGLFSGGGVRQGPVPQRRHSSNSSLPVIEQGGRETGSVKRSPKRISAPTIPLQAYDRESAGASGGVGGSVGHNVRNLDTGKLEAQTHGSTMTPEYVFGKAPR